MKSLCLLKGIPDYILYIFSRSSERGSCALYLRNKTSVSVFYCRLKYEYEFGCVCWRPRDLIIRTRMSMLFYSAIKQGSTTFPRITVLPFWHVTYPNPELHGHFHMGFNFARSPTIQNAFLHELCTLTNHICNMITSCIQINHCQIKVRKFAFHRVIHFISTIPVRVLICCICRWWVVSNNCTWINSPPWMETVYITARYGLHDCIFD